MEIENKVIGDYDLNEIALGGGRYAISEREYMRDVDNMG